MMEPREEDANRPVGHSGGQIQEEKTQNTDLGCSFMKLVFCVPLCSQLYL